MKDKGCSKEMNFGECELAILRMQVDKAQEKVARVVVNSPEVKEMITIVENFIKQKGLVCYGGISINALLPDDHKIYNQDVDLPDYDFFSPDALNDAKALANLYHELGYSDVEARSGQHHGTYKVFVNYQGMADITSLPRDLYDIIKKKSVRVNGISHVDPNFLRMSMYLELSRPAGDTSRWEKVMKRLTLINKFYPIDRSACKNIKPLNKEETTNNEELVEVVKDTLINQGVVFFGGFAISQYVNYMPDKKKTKFPIHESSYFDVISLNPETTAEILVERLKDIKVNNAKIIKREPVGEIIPLHYEIKVGARTVAFIYKPVACHSYNIIKIKNQNVKIATIDTMLSFYLAFLYSNRPYFSNHSNRILCMSEFLFDVQNKNRLKQDGLLQRFSITCYGKQETVEEIRAEKAAKFKEMKDKRGTPEFEEWFLNYKPEDVKSKHKEPNMTPSKNITEPANNDKPIKYLKSTKKNKNMRRKKHYRPTKKQYGNFLWGNKRTRKHKYY
jgi:hypothetical protein